MPILARCIGILIAGFGVVILIWPKTVKKLILFWEKEERLYVAAIVRITFGAVLLITAPKSTWPGIIATLGLLFLAGGIIIFVPGLEKMKSALERWKNLSPLRARLLAVLMTTIGDLLLKAV